jgi:hypothetical protein
VAESSRPNGHGEGTASLSVDTHCTTRSITTKSQRKKEKDSERKRSYNLGTLGGLDDG